MTRKRLGSAVFRLRLAAFGLVAASLALGGCRFPSYGFLDTPDDRPDACLGSGCAAPCAAGYADCDGIADDGCETALDARTACGACGVECTNNHGITACAAHAGADALCQPTCIAGYADCDLNPNNGCETSVNDDSLNCGGCGKACSANGGTPLCVAGQCGVSSCNAGFGDCTNSGSCSFRLNSDPQNCGACGHVCSSAHGSPSCNAGVCQIECEPGYGDCNAASAAGAPVPDDGCETKLNVPDSTASVPNCGACGAACNRRAFTVINLAQCALGVCARDCFAGSGDCDNNRSDPACAGNTCGCEVGLNGDAANCGACAHACRGGACVNGLCQCPDLKPKSGSTRCTLSSSVHCGPYAPDCLCTCSGGLFQCLDGGGKAC